MYTQRVRAVDRYTVYARSLRSGVTDSGLHTVRWVDAEIAEVVEIVQVTVLPIPAFEPFNLLSKTGQRFGSHDRPRT